MNSEGEPIQSQDASDLLRVLITVLDEVIEIDLVKRAVLEAKAFTVVVMDIHLVFGHFLH